MACILYSSGVLLQRQNHWKRPTWIVVRVYRSAVHMADCANYSSFKMQETHLGGITKQNHCPCFCVSRDYSFIIENKCYKLSTLWSWFLVSGPSVCSDFSWLAVIGFSWGTWIPTTWWVWCLKREWLGLFPLAFPTLFIVWDFFFHEFQFLLSKAHIILAFKFDHCK